MTEGFPRKWDLSCYNQMDLGKARLVDHPNLNRGLDWRMQWVLELKKAAQGE